MDSPKDRTRVCVVGLPEASACAIHSAIDDFSSVGRMGESLVFDSPPQRPPFTTQIVSSDGKPFECPSRATVVPHCAIDDVEQTGARIAHGQVLSVKGGIPQHLQCGHHKL